MTTTAPSPNDPDADTSLPPAFSTPRMLAFGVGSGVVAVGAASLAVISDDGGQRALLGIGAALSALLTGMFVLAAVRVRRARRDPEGKDGERLRRAAGQAPASVPRWRRAAGLFLCVAFLATVVVRGADGLSEPVRTSAEVVHVLLTVALGIFAAWEIMDQVRSRRGAGKR